MLKVQVAIRLRQKGGERVGQRMAEAKGINPQITTEEIMLTTEVKEEVKEAPSKLRQKLHELEATWERASTQFFQAPKL
jgi:uncharacterized protein YukE